MPSRVFVVCVCGFLSLFCFLFCFQTHLQWLRGSKKKSLLKTKGQQIAVPLKERRSSKESDSVTTTQPDYAVRPKRKLCESEGDTDLESQED